MQQLRFLTEAFMVTVDGVPVAPVSTMAEVDMVAEGVCSAFVSQKRDRPAGGGTARGNRQ